MRLFDSTPSTKHRACGVAVYDSRKLRGASARKTCELHVLLAGSRTAFRLQQYRQASLNRWTWSPRSPEVGGRRYVTEVVVLDGFDHTTAKFTLRTVHKEGSSNEAMFGIPSKPPKRSRSFAASRGAKLPSLAEDEI